MYSWCMLFLYLTPNARGQVNSWSTVETGEFCKIKGLGWALGNFCIPWKIFRSRLFKSSRIGCPCNYNARPRNWCCDFIDAVCMCMVTFQKRVPKSIMWFICPQIYFLVRAQTVELFPDLRLLKECCFILSSSRWRWDLTLFTLWCISNWQAGLLPFSLGNLKRCERITNKGKYFPDSTLLWSLQ